MTGLHKQEVIDDVHRTNIPSFAATKNFFKSASTHRDDADQHSSYRLPLDPTTNTPSLTIHHALIVCEAVRRVCPFDDDMDAKKDDWSDAPDQFSRKQLRNATILVLRRQKP